jgi:hypothetical protein
MARRIRQRATAVRDLSAKKNLYVHMKTLESAYRMVRNGTRLEARMCWLVDSFERPPGRHKTDQVAVVEGVDIVPHIVRYYGTSTQKSDIHTENGGTNYKIWLGIRNAEFDGFETSPTIFKCYASRGSPEIPNEKTLEAKKIRRQE